ncbi:hypothetical protein AB0M80_10850 [Amycolatopsis sp. NPDC051045]|uniref:hypothetical protein n=1 Tax=Amycolatopsis sp. NPDC051045 TaxID=3156922 RepID=UPI00341E0AB0
MTDHQHASEPARKVSGVVPVQFSASAEVHDDAVVAADRDATWRSPFASEGLRPASGE